MSFCRHTAPSAPTAVLLFIVPDFPVAFVIVLPRALGQAAGCVVVVSVGHGARLARDESLLDIPRHVVDTHDEPANLELNGFA
jgi:hypothetical protein